MKQTRRCVFETNSSSTHCLTMCMAEDYQKWIDGEVFFNDGVSSDSEFAYKQFVTPDEVRDVMRHYRYAEPGDPDPDTATIEEILDYFEDSFFTKKRYFDHFCLDGEFEESFVTPSGEKVIAFGVYGYDG